MAKNVLEQLSIDINTGKPRDNFSNEDLNEMMRGAINEAAGGKLDRYSFKDNKGAIFRVISEAMTPGLGVLLTDAFDDFVDVVEVDDGDIPTFNIVDASLFRVASVAAGTRDIRRQKVYNKKLDINVDKLAIKIYEDLDRFLAGRIDWAELTNRVQESYKAEIQTRIYEAIYDSYNDLEAPYQVNGSFDEELLLETINHVEASTGQKAGVFGTKTALAKIKLDPNVMSDDMKNKLNVLGHIGDFRGTPLFELPQAHKHGTNDFLVSDDFLLVVPVGEKIVKLVLEGDVVVDDTLGNETVRNDEQIEFFLGRKVGLGVLKANRYAIYRLDEENTKKYEFNDLVQAIEGETTTEGETRSVAKPKTENKTDKKE